MNIADPQCISNTSRKKQTRNSAKYDTVLISFITGAIWCSHLTVRLLFPDSGDLIICHVKVTVLVVCFGCNNVITFIGCFLSFPSFVKSNKKVGKLKTSPFRTWHLWIIPDKVNGESIKQVRKTGHKKLLWNMIKHRLSYIYIWADHWIPIICCFVANSDRWPSCGGENQEKNVYRDKGTWLPITHFTMRYTNLDVLLDIYTQRYFNMAFKVIEVVSNNLIELFFNNFILI